MAEILGLIAAAVMSLCAAAGQCRIEKPVKAGVFAAGFFTSAVYLNRLWLLLVEGFCESVGESRALDWLAVLIAQSIMLCALLLQYSIGSGGENAEEAVIKGGVKNDGKARGSGERFEYTDGVALGVSVFFLILAAEDFLTDKAMPAHPFETVSYRLVTITFRSAVLLGFYVSLIAYKERKRKEKRQEETLSRKREADTYLKNAEDNYQRTRELWHDLKNHINLLKLLLAEEKYGQMADYIRIFSEDVDSLTLPVKSGNVIVDALLADKAARAKKEGVEVTVSLCSLAELGMEPDDICGLFGNLLDNAIEANRRAQARRYIDVECREQETCYYFRIKNAAGGRAVQRDGYLLTSKTDRMNRVGHGLGLRSVERIVHGLGGELAVESKETEFTAVVRIPK